MSGYIVIQGQKQLVRGIKEWIEGEQDMTSRPCHLHALALSLVRWGYGQTLIHVAMEQSEDLPSCGKP